MTKKQIEALRLQKYKELGIDPLNPNPDGSDFHLMNTVDKEIEKELADPKASRSSLP